MPDFDMCASVLCPRAKDCKRSDLSGTKPDDDQDWEYFRKDGVECVHFWRAKG